MRKRTGFFSDVWCQLVLRLKLFLRDRATVAVFLISAACFLFCMADLNLSAEEKASIPVGLVCLDEGEKAVSLTEELKQASALYVTEGSYEELEERLFDGLLRCIIVIEEDYTKKLQKGNYRNVVSIYHEESDQVASVIGDIVAAGMMYDVCLARGYKAYEKLPEAELAKYTKEEYKAYVGSLLGAEDFDFAFEFRFVENTAGGQEETKPLENSLFYRQAVAAIAAMLMTLLQLTTMAVLQLERQQGITKRRLLTSMSKGAVFTGNLLANTVCSVLLALLFAFSVGVGIKAAEKIFPIFLISLLFSMGMAVVYYILAQCLKSVLAYQIFGAVWLLVSGISGFFYMAEGILVPELPGLIKALPNVVYLDYFTRLLL